jgi:hypothetical protein
MKAQLESDSRSKPLRGLSVKLAGTDCRCVGAARASWDSGVSSAWPKPPKFSSASDSGAAGVDCGAAALCTG